MKRLWVDANVLLRFLTGEPEGMAERFARLMRRAEAGEVRLVLSPLVLAEILWVLKSFYGHSYVDIARVVIPLLSADGVEIDQRELMIQAIAGEGQERGLPRCHPRPSSPPPSRDRVHL